MRESVTSEDRRSSPECYRFSTVPKLFQKCMLLGQKGQYFERKQCPRIGVRPWGRGIYMRADVLTGLPTKQGVGSSNLSGRTILSDGNRLRSGATTLSPRGSSCPTLSGWTRRCLGLFCCPLRGATLLGNSKEYLLCGRRRWPHSSWRSRRSDGRCFQQV